MPNKKLVWTGRVLSALVALPFVMGAAMGFTGNPQVAQGMAHFGIPAPLVLPLAVVQIACAVLYLVPATSVLGAILLAGYMGGAILTRLRVGDNFAGDIAFGVVAWLGIWLREPRLWQVLPLRKKRE